MKKFVLTAFVILVSLGVFADRANAVQSAVLAEMYGRGVHAYYAGDNHTAARYLSMAIDNGSEDPRAYYFRGMVAHASGRANEAELDWQRGAELEATGRANPTIGRSITRFQGSARIQLEEIRQSARLNALASSTVRSQQRYDEIKAAEPNVLRGAPLPPPAAAPSAAIAPPSAAAAAENPFSDDMAAGEPKVTADDALEGAMTDPFADDAVPAGAAPAAGGDGNPFGGAGGDADPFGGGSDAGADPFGGGGDAGAPIDDPFGGGADPFGN